VGAENRKRTAQGFRVPVWLWAIAAVVAFKLVILPGLLQPEHALVGKPVPAIELPPLPGAPATVKGAPKVHLDQLAGKVVVLDFWAPWCGPCRQEMPVLDGIAKRYADKGVVVMGVLVDPDRDGARDVLVHGKIGYPQLDDESGAASKAFSIRSLPSLVVVDKKGVVRTYRTGYTSEAELEAAIKSAL
jgi:thiol-disulfide isomerase/thioredoxin